MMQGKIDIFGMTDQGRVRRRNEDQFLVADLTKSLRLHQSSLSIEDNETLFGGSQGQLLMVADGVGGRAAGDRASRIAVQTMTTFMLNTMPWFYRLSPATDDDYRDELVDALKQCENSLTTETDAHPDDAGMGTTLTMSYIIWPRMYLLHVGDSRCYLSRNRELRQLTRDHTVKEKLREAGVVEDDDAELWANTLWNSIQADGDATPDVFRVNLEVGDTLLLCSDGLIKHVDDEAIQTTLQTGFSAEDQCRSLIQDAVNAGGTDNVTAIVARFLDQQLALDEAAQSASLPAESSQLSDQSTLDRALPEPSLFDADSAQADLTTELPGRQPEATRIA